MDRGGGHHRASASRSRACTPPGSRSTTCSTPACSATCSTPGTARSRSSASRCSCSRSRCCALLLHRRPAAEHPLRWWWMVSALVVGAGIAVDARHRRSREQRHPDRARDPGRPRARRRHGVLARRSRGVVRRGAPAPRRRRAAGGAAALLGARAWARSSRSSCRAGTRRGVRSAASTSSKSTDYGRLLIAKLVAFAALIVAAAFSREIVNRRFRDAAPTTTSSSPAEDPVLVGAGAGGPAGAMPAGGSADGWTRRRRG